MKKLTVVSLALAFLLGVVAMPLIVSAQKVPPTSCNVTHDLGDYIPGCVEGEIEFNAELDGYSGGICCFLNSLATITDWIFAVLLIIVGLLILIGALFIITAAGDPTKIGKGKDFIMYALIGLAVALLSKALVPLVTTVMGIKSMGI